MIFAPGQYTPDQLSIEQYHHELDAVSKTELDRIHRSIAHWQYAKANPPESTSKCFETGTALHTLVLTPTLFDKEYTVVPKYDRRTREGKALHEKYAAIGKPTLSDEDYYVLQAMAASIQAHPAALELLSAKGVAENSFLWVDPITGLQCKCRPDWLTDMVIVDLKSCKDASFASFQKEVAAYRYDVQGAYFSDGVRAVLNDHARDFVLIAVEKEPPYAVAVYKLDEEAIEMGRGLYQKDLQKVSLWKNDPTLWQGYHKDVQKMSLPRWAKNREEVIDFVTTGVLL